MKKRYGHKLIDLTGHRFGNLIVTARGKTQGNMVYWLCKCSCGNIKEVRSDCLRKRGTSHCGCKNYVIDKNKKYGKLKPLKRIVFKDKKSRSRAYWECKCDCGNTKLILTSCLKEGRTKSCGCSSHERPSTRHIKVCGDISPSFWRRIVDGARFRNIKFSINCKTAWEKFIQQEGMCALSGVKLELTKKARELQYSTASLDRIDSNKGYTKDNIQWVHKTINLMKNKLSEKEFLHFCRLVVNKKCN